VREINGQTQLKPTKLKGEFKNQIKSLERNISDHSKLLRQVGTTKRDNDSIDDEIVIEDTAPSFKQLINENKIRIKRKY